MGEAELRLNERQIIIHAVFYLYGEKASVDLAGQVATDISNLWNEPRATVRLKKYDFRIVFDILGLYEPQLDPEMVWYNDNPRFNFFRVEEFVVGDISFVDGLGSNTGYFKLANLQQTATTAAHEFGHTLGLDHPTNIDIRGAGIPGIMYPRGTLCDPAFQYDPEVEAGKKGGTLNPAFRKVRQEDIDLLGLSTLHFNKQGLSGIGHFSSMYHEKHLPAASR